MPSINTPASGHVGPVAFVGGHSYLSYTDAAYLATLKSAIAIINNRIKSYKPCNDAFKALPGGKTLAGLWADATIWINFDPSKVVKDFGATRGKDITITAYSLRMGRWTVAATLVHEMAHVNGAGGGDAKAEDTLLKCLLHGLHDPGIIGQLLKPNPARYIA
jgi:hypothetical protein